MVRHADVCVIGGGPAGAMLAGRLALLGHDVVVLDAGASARAGVAESLTPRVEPLLELAGADGYAGSPGVPASVWWDSPEPRLVATHGITVERPAFDARLLEAARLRGASVHAPAVAGGFRRSGEGWEVSVASEGGRSVVRARFLVDATGRKSRLRVPRHWTAPRLIALHAQWPRWRERDTCARVAALGTGWVWAARVPGGGARAIAFLDPRTLRRSERDRVYFRMLDEAGVLERVEGARGPVRTCDATPYSTESPIDEVSARVGEAAFAVDPLSSAGIYTALQSAIAAGAAVHTLLSGKGDAAAALQYYTDHVAHSVEQHRRWTEDSYARHRLHRGEPFWAARRGGPPEPEAPALAVRLADLWGRRVRLAGDVSTVRTPCVVGDHVELRRALVSPRLARPVAFVNDVEIVPLLDHLTRVSTLGDAVEGWKAANVRQETCLAIARWLQRRDLLVPA